MHNILTNDINIILQNRANRDDGGFAGDGSGDEFFDLLVLGFSGVFFYEVYFVLEDYDIFEAHYFDGGEVLGGLGLGAGLGGGEGGSEASGERTVEPC